MQNTSLPHANQGPDLTACQDTALTLSECKIWLTAVKAVSTKSFWVTRLWTCCRHDSVSLFVSIKSESMRLCLFYWWTSIQFETIEQSGADWSCVVSLATPSAAEPLHIWGLHVPKVTPPCTSKLHLPVALSCSFWCPGGQQTHFCSCECQTKYFS